MVYPDVNDTLDMSDHQYHLIRAREGQKGGGHYLEREGTLVALACILHEPAPACEREGCEGRSGSTFKAHCKQTHY